MKKTDRAATGVGHCSEWWAVLLCRLIYVFERGVAAQMFRFMVSQNYDISTRKCKSKQRDHIKKILVTVILVSESVV